MYITPNDTANSDAQATLAVTEEKIFTDLEGNPVTFTEYEGKVRIVTSWASWNPFSAQELETFEAVAQTYIDKEIVIIAINRKEPKEQAQRFLKTLPQFPHIIFAIDQSDAFYSSVGGYAMPETIFYDNSGNIIEHVRGTLTQEQIRIYIDRAFKSQE